MPNTIKTFLAFLFLVLFSSQLWALPIDWHGTFGVDSTLLDNFRRINQKTNSSPAGGTGSQEVLTTSNQANASWQSYLFKLSPVLIVNDSATFRGEISNGYARGGILGDAPTRTQDDVKLGTDTFGNALYHYNNSFPGADNKLVMNKFYMELYSDTATYQLGRHETHWGLGAIFNDGEKLWDRHSSTRDGLTMKVKIGNFHFEPYWAKMDMVTSLTRATNAKQYGLSLLYDNVDRDIAFGLMYSKMKIKNGNTNQTFNISGTETSMGESNVKLIDIYFKKIFNRLTIELEVPLFSGDLGTIYGSGTTKYKSKAILFESNYNFNESWSAGLNAGKVAGDSGGQSSFEAMYLNPNYQIANLLFRYNLGAVSNNAKNVYDSNVVNAAYLKAHAKYLADKWTWNAGVIYALAEEVAKNGKDSFNHTTNKTFTASADQSDDLGLELDFGFDYKWNNEVSIGGNFGYLMTGDYYGFNDTAAPFKTKNAMVLQIQSAINF